MINHKHCQECGIIIYPYQEVCYKCLKKFVEEEQKPRGEFYNPIIQELNSIK